MTNDEQGHHRRNLAVVLIHRSLDGPIDDVDADG
jgi:hypothetical protein